MINDTDEAITARARTTHSLLARALDAEQRMTRWKTAHCTTIDGFERERREHAAVPYTSPTLAEVVGALESEAGLAVLTERTTFIEGAAARLCGQR